MPLLELKCGSCGTAFEYLKRGAGDEPVCPKCGGNEVKGLLSVFAVSGPSARPSEGPACGGDLASCARCGPGASWN